MTRGNLHRVHILVLLLGVVVASSLARAQGIPGVSFEVIRFDIQGSNPLGASATGEILAPFLGKHDGLERLLGASTTLENAMRDRGHAFHRVILPPQTLEAGVVVLEVLSFKITGVEVQGNEHFDKENIKRSLPLLVVDGEPDTTALSRAVRVANRHPSKTVKVAFADSKKSDGIVAKITTQDSKPWSVFASLDNTGSADTGFLRLSVGGQYTNLFNRDHQLTASYTTSPQRQADVRQKGVNYDFPIYGYQTNVTVFYADSDVSTGQVAGLDISGAGQFLGLRIRHELLRGDGYTHSVTVGIDDKLFESRAVPIGGTASLFPNVRTRPISIEYARDYESLTGNWGFAVSYARNLPRGGSNNAGAYLGNRAEAPVAWDVIRWRTYLDWAFESGALLRASAEGQWARDPLLSGEQFGVGGARSVRGFSERAISGDSGVRAGLELWTAPLESTVNARLMGFVEWGHVVVHSPSFGQDHGESAAGTGVGFRMQGTAWSAVGSFARVLDRASQADPGDVRAHFSTVWRY